MQVKLSYLILLPVSALLASCSSLYLPNVPATPMFTDKGEAYVAGHSTLKGGLSANAGVALSNNIAFIANGFFMEQGGIQRNELFKQQNIEAGLGYFTKVGKNKRQVFEVYAGYGIGTSVEEDRRAGMQGMETQELREMDFDKIFLQVNYSSTKKSRLNLFGKKRTLNYGTAIRLSRVSMTDFQINGVSQQKEEALFVEPLFFTRMELNKHFQLQYTNGFNFNMLDNEYLKAGNAVFTLGITYNFGSKKK